MAQLWRFSGLEPWGVGDLEIGELQMWAGGVRVDSGATITSSVAPFSGALSALADNDATTQVVFSAAQRRNVLTVTYDMGVDVPDVDQVKLGLGLTKEKSLRWFALEKFDSGVWVNASFNSGAGRVGSVTFTTAEDLVSVERFEATYLRFVATRWIYSGQAVSHGLFESNGLPGGGEILIQELEYVDRAGTVHPNADLTGYSAPSPFVVTNSTEYVGGVYNGWKAFDGISNSAANPFVTAPANTGDQQITIQLDQAIELVTIRVCPDGNVGAGFYMLSFDVLGSTTGLFAGEEKLLHRETNNVNPGFANFTFRDFPVLNRGASIGTESTSESRRTFDIGVDQMLGAFEFENPSLTTFDVGVELTNNDNLEGNGEILGTVKIEADPDDEDVPDIPVRRLVRLYRDMDGKFVDSTYSDAVTGAYAFRYLNRSYTYNTHTFDPTHSYRTEGADGIVPTLMS